MHRSNWFPKSHQTVLWCLFFNSRRSWTIWNDERNCVSNWFQSFKPYIYKSYFFSWRYYSAEELGSSSYWGKLTTYSGAGSYVVCISIIMHSKPLHECLIFRTFRPRKTKQKFNWQNFEKTFGSQEELESCSLISQYTTPTSTCSVSSSKLLI